MGLFFLGFFGRKTCHQWYSTVKIKGKLVRIMETVMTFIIAKDVPHTLLSPLHILTRVLLTQRDRYY